MQGAPNGRPFVVVDCSRSDTLENRLFGIARGADKTQAGDLDRITEGSALHQTLEGTLVITRVPEMPGRLQTRLARVLRDGEVWVQLADGTDVAARVAVRPIATIESDANGDLVPDLRKRLSQTTIAIPSLRERREDVPALVKCLLADLCAAAGVPTKVASTQAIALLSALPWRRNLTELEDLLRSLMMRVAAPVIRVADVLAHVQLDGGIAPSIYGGTLKEARERFEREYVAAALEHHRGRMAATAKALGLQRTNLYRKVRQLSVERRPRGRQVS
jgi:DNA-binding NtrC family response regulator